MPQRLFKPLAASLALLLFPGLLSISFAMLTDEDEKAVLKYSDAKRILSEHNVDARNSEDKITSYRRADYNANGWGLRNGSYWGSSRTDHDLQTNQDWQLRESYLIETCSACKKAHNYIREYEDKKKAKRLEEEQRIKTIEKMAVRLQELEEEKKNVELCFLSTEKEVSFLKNLKTEDKNLKECIASLSEKSEQLRKIFSLSSSNPSLKPLLIPEDQVPGHCVAMLLKKDPKIFLPWIPTKEVHELIKSDISSNNPSLPSYIVVEDEQAEEGKTPLLSYIKEKLESGLDAEITLLGKSNFKKMVSSIEQIQGPFWTSGETHATVAALLKKLNDGTDEKEWVNGWKDLEEDYKKYIAATVLYKINTKALPKKYEDIESFLKDK